MNTEEFIEAIRTGCRDGTTLGLSELLADPPGRQPHAWLIELSKWYKQLPDTDRRNVQRVMRKAAESAIFGFFCVLDGVRAVEDRPDKGRFELWYVHESGNKLLNPESGEMLHDIFNTEADKG